MTPMTMVALVVGMVTGVAGALALLMWLALYTDYGDDD